MMNTTAGPFDVPDPHDDPAQALPRPTAADRHRHNEPRVPAWQQRVDPTALRSTVPLLMSVTATFAVTTRSGNFGSVGVAVALTVLFAAVARSGARDRRATALTFGGIALLPWLAIRQSPWLIVVDIAVAAALLITAASVRPGEPIAPRLVTLLFAWGNAIGSATHGPRLTVAEITTATSRCSVRRDQITTAVRTAVAATSVVALAVTLLVSGDALIASYFPSGVELEWFHTTLLGALMGAGAGFVLFVGLIGMFRSTGRPAPVLRSARPLTLFVTMVGLVTTIGLYGIVQIVAVMSGDDYVEQRTGLTYAEYARSGFFQVVAVTFITVVVLSAVRSTCRTGSVNRRPFTVLAGLLTAAVVSLVGTSVVKLGIYAERFGLTMLRVYTIVFALWLGLVALLTFAALVRSSDRWLTPVVLASIAIGAFGMNIANPERLVAAHNIERARQGAELDLDYLGKLSNDALPTILSGLSELGIAIEVDGRSDRPTPWCRRVDDRAGFAANAAVSAAAAAQAEFCPLTASD